MTSTRPLHIGLAVTALIFLSACATKPLPTAELSVGAQAVQANTNATDSEYEPAELDDARLRRDREKNPPTPR